MKTRTCLIAAISATATAALRADIVSLNPVADAFVSSAQPTGNFGGAGALSLAAPGLTQGEFQTLIRFDTAPAVASFNATYGAGNWVITSISLGLTSTSPNNPIFNAAGAGDFSLTWMQNDQWLEGTGGPSAPSATGISFATLPSFLSAGDEPLGAFTYNGATSGSVVCQLATTPGFTSDVALGGLISLRLAAASSTTAWVFNSRTFGTAANRPVMSITAVPAPGVATSLALFSAMALRRRRGS